MADTMTHLSYRKDEDVDLTVDYAVVGSGCGGSMAGVVLARGGAEVAIVEAGAWRDPEDYPYSAYGAMRDLMDSWSSTTTLGRAIWPIVQGSAVGGSTVINSAITVRTPGDVFSRWEREFGVGGDEMAQAAWRYQDLVEQELHVEEVPRASLGNSNLLALKADKALGLEGYVMQRYVKACAGTGQCLQGCRGRKKQSTNLNYIPEVMRRGGSVLSCAPVRKVVFEGRRSVGVRGRFVHPLTKKKGAQFMVRARKGVLLAASVTHTPLLLRASGVRHKAVGKRFQGHPGVGVFGIYDEPVDMIKGATQGWASVKFRNRGPGIKLETLSLPIELVASRLSGGGTQLMKRIAEYRHFAMWVGALQADALGTVSPGPFGPVVRYSLTRDDMVRFREALKQVAQMHVAAGAKELVTGIYGLPYKIGVDQVSLLDDAPLDPRRYISIISHLFGGAYMGRDPAKSVCDANGQVHGYDGLYIVDASVMPTNIGVNPQHTIMGIAGFFAERILNK